MATLWVYKTKFYTVIIFANFFLCPRASYLKHKSSLQTTEPGLKQGDLNCMLLRNTIW